MDSPAFEQSADVGTKAPLPLETTFVGFGEPFDTGNFTCVFDAWYELDMRFS
jgi:hypothetical protein